MALNLEDNKRPYFKQLNLDETFDEIQNAVNALESSTPTINYKVYTANLFQSGLLAPVATVFENTLGGTIVWSYNDIGSFTGTLTGAFTNNKTAIFLSPSYSDTSATNDYLDVVSVARASDNAINIFTAGATADGSREAENGVLSHTLEIRVYN